MQFSHPLMDTEEYKELFKKAKSEYPEEYDYFLHIACIAYLTEVNEDKKAQAEEEETYDIIKSDVNIEIPDEIQKEHTTE